MWASLSVSVSTPSATVDKPLIDVAGFPGTATAHVKPPSPLIERVTCRVLGGLGDPVTGQLSSVERLRLRKAPVLRDRPDARRLELGEELGRKRVAGLERDRRFQMADGGVSMALRDVVVCQHELGRGRCGVCLYVRLQRAKLLGVKIRVVVIPNQAGPVPAGTDGKDRVERCRGLLVLSLGEEDEAEELVHRGVIRYLCERLLSACQGGRVVVRPEGVAGLVEGRGRLIGRGCLRRRAAAVLSGCE